MLELINSRLIEENDSVLIVVYAANQKGRSTGVIVRDFELGVTQILDKGKELTAVAGDEKLMSESKTFLHPKKSLSTVL